MCRRRKLGRTGTVRKLFWVTAPACAAVFLAVLLLPGEALLPVGAVCGAVGLAAFLWRGKTGRKARLAALGLCFGFVWTFWAGQALVAPAQELDGTKGAFTAVITDWPRPTAYGSSVSVTLTASGRTVDALLYLDGEDLPALRPGDRVEGTASFRLANRMRGEESFLSYASGTWLTASAGEEVTVYQSEEIPLSLRPAWWRKALTDALTAAFPADTAPLAVALATGDESGLEDGIYSDLQRVGLAHVVAVSGLHISFLCGTALRLLGRNRRRTALFALVLMALFAAMTGGSPSVLRASFMQGMLLLAPLLGREEDTPTSLALALFLLLLRNPYAAAGLGLQLSFASVAGICLVSGPLYRRWTGWLPQSKGVIGALCKVWQWAAASLTTTAGALVLTTPITTLSFGTFSLIAPLANLAALWAVAITFVGAILTGTIALWLLPLGEVLGAVFSLTGRYVLWCAEGLARLPLAAVSLDGIFLQMWLGAVYALLVLGLLWRRERGRMVLPVCAGACTLCAALLCTAWPMAQSGFTVTVLDVGQGQSVALTTPGSTVLVDCGGNGWRNAGDVAADYLQTRGRSRVDVLILTHYHSDHANGVKQLLRRMEVGLLLAPEVREEGALQQELLQMAQAAGTQVCLLRENAEVTLDGAQLTVYAPLGAGETNEEGLAVLGTREEFDVLLTGDMDEIIEGRLIKYGNLPDVELLVAGHHGSAHATSPALLEEIQPEYAAISVGYNTYGHPSWDTLERLQAAGCAIYTTREMGHLTFRVR